MLFRSDARLGARPIAERRLAMRARLGRRRALRASGNAFRLNTEVPNRLFDGGLESFSGEGAGKRRGEDSRSLGREGLLRHLPVRSDTLVDTHAQPS